MVTAALLNGLKLAGKTLKEAKIVVSGAGAAALACLGLLESYGLQHKNIWVFDSKGLLSLERKDLDTVKAVFARRDGACTLQDALLDADVFLGLSAAGVLKGEMIKPMAERPLIFGLANPIPEIMPEEALAIRPDALLATGRSDYPNQVNNVLCFPYIFRGALDCGATAINVAMKKACVKALCALSQKPITQTVKRAYPTVADGFGPTYLLPTPFDERLLLEVAPCVAKAAMDTGVATRPIEDFVAYGERLRALQVTS